jgi:hypothetical protein
METVHNAILPAPARPGAPPCRATRAAVAGHVALRRSRARLVPLMRFWYSIGRAAEPNRAKVGTLPVGGLS